MTPKRAAEIVDGGSLYWVIKGQISPRGSKSSASSRSSTRTGSAGASCGSTAKSLRSRRARCAPFRAGAIMSPSPRRRTSTRPSPASRRCRKGCDGNSPASGFCELSPWACESCSSSLGPPPTNVGALCRATASSRMRRPRSCTPSRSTRRRNASGHGSRKWGAGRAGWYSYDSIDNDGHPSATEVIPELQHLAVGDVVPALPGARDAFVVAAVEPLRDLVLAVPEAGGGHLVSWEFFLEPRADGVRMLVRGRVGAKWPARRSRAPVEPAPADRARLSLFLP